MGVTSITRTKKLLQSRSFFYFYQHPMGPFVAMDMINLYDMDYAKAVVLFFFGFVYFFENKR